MERQNRFDDAIKAKLNAIDEAPSAQVWAGVQGQIGVVRPPMSWAMPLRIAAGIALLATASAAWYWLQPSGAPQRALALRDDVTVRHIIVVPLDRMGQQDTYLAQGTPAPQEATAPAAPRKRRTQPGTFAAHDTAQQAPQHTPQPLPEQLVEQQAPKNETPKLPQVPDTRSTSPADDHREVRTEIASAAPTKRTFKMPNRDAGNGLKNQSGAILGAITTGANTFLGLDASYDERIEDDRKLTAFNADFGLFKIKKVRTVKP